ncbi:unnamed protein product [Amoebophrya sp. A120]|nr:unnamed protein product [Amoebophrya sp. A120]|eukprot:GSA120T00019194001.1
MRRFHLLSLALLVPVTAKLKLKKNVVPITTGKVYPDAMAACCACFKVKYSFPENGGFAPTFALKHTCNTCYVADRYGTDAKEEETFDVPAGHAKTEEGYEQTKAEVKAIHEWNWNCAEGKAPEDEAQFAAGPVPGEPSARSSFLMCKEDPGWYCAMEGGPDMKKPAGDGEVEKLDEDTGSDTLVETMSMPEIGAE